MNKACHFCGNIGFKHKRVQYIYTHHDKLLVVNNVPCEVCDYCGEEYFSADVLKKIERDFSDIYGSRKKAAHEIKVPMEEFSLS